MIVIEGLDATGKSTLANIIASEYNLNIQESEGPPQSQEEFLQRIERYFILTQTIFVRHPLVSNPIYDIGRAPEKVITIPAYYFNAFYSLPSMFIYCERVSTLVGHQVKDHDTPEHLAMISDPKVDQLMHAAYQRWALERAHIIYRIGDAPRRILDLLAYKMGRRAR